MAQPALTAAKVGAIGSFCSIQKRALGLASEDKKVFILHDEDQNSTIARHQTAGLAAKLDDMGVTTYYRNGPFTSYGSDPNADPLDLASYKRSWLGRNKGDLGKSVQFVRATCDAKGPYYALMALGKSIPIAEAVAAKHDMQIQVISPSNQPPTSVLYPILFLTSQKAYRFIVDLPSPLDTDITPQLLDLPIVGDISKVVDGKSKIFAFPKPSLAELKAQKQARKAAQRERSMQGPLHKDRTNEPTDPNAASEYKPLKKPEWSWPYAPAAIAEWAAKPDLPNPTDSGEGQLHPATAPVSNYISSPAAEPVTPCTLDSLEPMIQWLNRNEDFNPSQEPRVDFTKGSILGKTTRGGGVSVDLCKQVVGPVGIGPIMDAVANNDNIDRFLLGNNIVTDQGAEIIANVIRRDKQKPNGGRIYNYYLAGNSISAKGISSISDALTHDPVVTALWLKRNNLGPDGALALSNMLAQNTRLEVLDLVNTNVGDAGAEHVFRALAQNPNSALRHLYFGTAGHGVATAQAAAAYLKSGPCRLRTLFFGLSRLGDDGAKVLAEGLREQETIERLGLSSCLIGDVGAVAIADALREGKGSKAIVNLDLGWRRGTLELGEEGNFIEDEGAMKLGELLLRTGLRAIDLTNSKMSFDGMEEFMKRFVEGNERVLDVKLKQRYDGTRRNVKAERRAKEIRQANWAKFEEGLKEATDAVEIAEMERVKDALEPQHVKEIYSVYRGNM